MDFQEYWLARNWVNYWSIIGQLLAGYWFCSGVVQTHIFHFVAVGNREFMNFTKEYLMSAQCDWLFIASVEMKRKSRMREDQFVSVFGLSSTTIHRIHFVYLLESTLWRPKYLLWAFHFLKNYNVRRSAYTSFRNCSENFFSMGVWKVVALLYTDFNEVCIFLI
jgi:hypothetical protein